MNFAANAPGDIPSDFLKTEKKVLPVEKPDSIPIASIVISSALPSLRSVLACLLSIHYGVCQIIQTRLGTKEWLLDLKELNKVLNLRKVIYLQCGVHFES